MLENELLSFVRNSVRSTWALEMLLLLRARRPHALTRSELVLELRATNSLIANCAKQLQTAGLVACEHDSCSYAPASPTLEHLCDQLDAVYRERPVTIINAIVATPNDRLKTFADAFRFTKKDE